MTDFLNAVAAITVSLVMMWAMWRFGAKGIVDGMRVLFIRLAHGPTDKPVNHRQVEQQIQRLERELGIGDARDA